MEIWRPPSDEEKQKNEYITNWEGREGENNPKAATGNGVQVRKCNRIKATSYRKCSSLLSK